MVRIWNVNIWIVEEVKALPALTRAIGSDQISRKEAVVIQTRHRFISLPSFLIPDVADL